MEELKADIEELQKLKEQSTRPKVQDILLIEIRKLQTELSKHHEAAASFTQAPSEKPMAAATNKRYTVDIQSYAWDQSDKFLKIYATLSGVQNTDSTNIKSEFTERTFRLSVENLDGKNHVLHVANLWENIVPDKCYHKVKTDMVLLMLKKAEEKKTWAYVTEKDDKKKKSKKPDEKGDPQESLMNMLKDMYDEGDDDMKRTIAQAWSKSREKGDAVP